MKREGCGELGTDLALLVSGGVTLVGVGVGVFTGWKAIKETRKTNDLEVQLVQDEQELNTANTNFKNNDDVNLDLDNYNNLLAAERRFGDTSTRLACRKNKMPTSTKIGIASTVVLGVIGTVLTGLSVYCNKELPEPPSPYASLGNSIQSCNTTETELAQNTPYQCELNLFASKVVGYIKDVGISGSHFVDVGGKLHQVASYLVNIVNSTNRPICNSSLNNFGYICPPVAYNNSLCEKLVSDSQILLNGLKGIETITYTSASENVKGNKANITLGGSIQSYDAQPSVPSDLHIPSYKDNLERILIGIIYGYDICT